MRAEQRVPVLSIGMSMFDSASTIESAVRSLLLQTMTDWELIVIDDGSRDDSVERVRAFRDPRIRIHVDGRNLGLPTRLNQAVDLARGRYFARFDADDICYPERLERQTLFLDTHRQVDLVGTAMLVFDADGRALGTYRVQAEHEQICARPLSGFHLPHPSWMGRVEWFRRWRYDPSFRKAQDQELLLRAWRGSRYAAIPTPLVGYRQDAVSLGKSLAGRWHFSRALLRTTAGEGRPAAGAFAVSMQAVKLAIDAVAIVTGTTRMLLQHRARKCPETDRGRWVQVWASVHGTAETANG